MSAPLIGCGVTFEDVPVTPRWHQRRIEQAPAIHLTQVMAGRTVIKLTLSAAAVKDLCQKLT